MGGVSGCGGLDNTSFDLGVDGSEAWISSASHIGKVSLHASTSTSFVSVPSQVVSWKAELSKIQFK